VWWHALNVLTGEEERVQVVMTSANALGVTALEAPATGGLGIVVGPVAMQ
jgi:hypothetical protein